MDFPRRAPEVHGRFVYLGNCLLIDVGAILCWSEVDFCIIEHAPDMARGDYGHVKKFREIFANKRNIDKPDSQRV